MDEYFDQEKVGACVMRPVDEAELAGMVRDAAGPLRIVGGGTRAIGAVTGEVLETGGLAGITLYEPGALTLVAKAGTPLADVEAALANEGQRLAFEPSDMRALLGRKGTATIGGMVAANASGPRRVAVGACRDFLLGARFVDGQGSVIKNGGRVMKNVTGYDLARLMSGAHGTLGVLSEVSLKVLPMPEVSVTLRADGLDAGRAIEALSGALGSPYDVSGAAHIVGGALMLRLEGFEASVAYRAKELMAHLAGFGAFSLDPDADWAAIRDVREFGDLAGDVWRISVAPSAAADVLARIDATRAICDWGGGLIFALVEGGRDLRRDLGAMAGHATLMRADEATIARLGAFHPEAAGNAALTAGLRARFDPRGILNSGLMG
ncbi:MAG: glycolate oxidase FAD binding subunit [Halocynthiibacter sp.]